MSFTDKARYLGLNIESLATVMIFILTGQSGYEDVSPDNPIKFDAMILTVHLQRANGGAQFD